MSRHTVYKINNNSNNNNDDDIIVQRRTKENFQLDRLIQLHEARKNLNETQKG